ncbi:MAG: phosphate signaling complex protein PhoU [Oscillospiraceae bacterium]|nr:phosphate signaling complex protein PhoU [Oscillospiraceae bacterium]
MRNKFLGQLEALHEMLLEMGTLVQIGITKAADALKSQDKALAKEVIESDNEINQIEKDIEALCMKILIRQNPVAGDFRLVSSALKMITDMERIGDQAADIAEISTYFDKPFIKKLEHIPQMAEATIKMVTDSINAFVKNDLELANQVIAQDDLVDELFTTVKNDLIALIGKDANNGEQAIDLIMVAKYFERIGDHATNIAEWVVYSITGTHPDTVAANN